VPHFRTLDVPEPPVVSGELLGAPLPPFPAEPVLQPIVQVAPPVATPAIEGPPPLDLAAVAYTLRNLPPDVLIRLAFAEFGPRVVDRFLAIARRESGLGKRGAPVPYDPSCAADNPTSSASGLFQYLDGWAGYGGFDWALIVSRDCYEDVMMTVAVYRANGFGPWT
jgi:hypothetical protein